MPGPISELEKTALLFAAGYLTEKKPSIVGALTTPLSSTVDAIVNFIKSNEPHGGIMAVIDAAVNKLLDSVDASLKANAPTEVGAAIDFVVAELNKLALAV